MQRNHTWNPFEFWVAVALAGEKVQEAARNQFEKAKAKVAKVQGRLLFFSQGLWLTAIKQLQFSVPEGRGWGTVAAQ